MLHPLHALTVASGIQYRVRFAMAGRERAFTSSANGTVALGRRHGFNYTHGVRVPHCDQEWMGSIVCSIAAAKGRTTSGWVSKKTVRKISLACGLFCEAGIHVHTLPCSWREYKQQSASIGDGYTILTR